MLAIAEMLERLAELHAQREALERENQSLIEEAVPPEVRSKLDEIEAEFRGRLEAAATRIEELEASIKSATLTHGESVRGRVFQAVWNKGRQTWDSKGLAAYAESHPDVLPYRKEGEPTVTVRRVGGKEAE